MAYGTKYTCEVPSMDGYRYRVTLALWGYAGASEAYPASPSGIVLATGQAGDAGFAQALAPSTLTLRLVVPPMQRRRAGFTLTDLATRDARAWRVQLVRYALVEGEWAEDGIEWTGYVPVNGFQDEAPWRRGVVTVTATAGYDAMNAAAAPGLGEDELYATFPPPQRYATLRRLIAHAAESVGYERDAALTTLCDLSPATSAAITGDVLAAIGTDRRLWATSSGRAVITTARAAAEETCTALGLELVLSDGQWWALSRTALARGAGRLFASTTGGGAPSDIGGALDLDFAPRTGPPTGGAYTRVSLTGVYHIPAATSASAVYRPSAFNLVENLDLSSQGASGAAYADGWTSTPTASTKALRVHLYADLSGALTFEQSVQKDMQESDAGKAFLRNAGSDYAVLVYTVASAAPAVLMRSDRGFATPGATGARLIASAQIAKHLAEATTADVAAVGVEVGDHTLSFWRTAAEAAFTSTTTLRMAFWTPATHPNGSARTRQPWAAFDEVAMGPGRSLTAGTVVLPKGYRFTVGINYTPVEVELLEPLAVGDRAMYVRTVGGAFEPVEAVASPYGKRPALYECQIPYFRHASDGATAYDYLPVKSTQVISEAQRVEEVGAVVPLVDLTGRAVEGLVRMTIRGGYGEGKALVGHLACSLEGENERPADRLAYGAHALGAPAGGVAQAVECRFDTGPIGEETSALRDVRGLVPQRIPITDGTWTRRAPPAGGSAVAGGTTLATAQARSLVAQMRGGVAQYALAIDLRGTPDDPGDRLRAHHVLALAPGHGLPGLSNASDARLHRASIVWDVHAARVNGVYTPLVYDERPDVTTSLSLS